MDAADQAVDEATQEAAETADTAAESVESATDEAAQATEEAVDAAQAEATDSATGGMADWMTVDGFNMDKAAEAIDNSSLGDMQKTLLKGTLEKAQENPDLLKSALEKVREALGM